MKILLLHHRLPYPLFSGMDKVRYNMIKMLSEKHDVTLVVSADEKTTTENINKIKSITGTLHIINVKNKVKQIKNSKKLYYKRWWDLIFNNIPTYATNDFHHELQTFLKEHLKSNSYDIIQSLSHVSGKYILDIDTNAKVIVGPIDDTIKTAKTYINVQEGFKKKLLWKFEHKARKSFHQKLINASNITLFFSEEDIESLEKVVKKNNHRFIKIKTAVEIEHEYIPFNRDEIENGSVIFIGGLGPLFNQHAVLFFYENIFNLIKRKNPEAKFYIVGQNPPPKILKLKNDPSVIVTGEVDDLTPYINKAQVYVSPLYSGSGFKTKIIEALRYAKPIVTTTLGIQGLWSYGKNVFYITDHPEEFAEFVTKLLNDKELCKIKSEASRKLFEQEYSYEVIKSSLLKSYSEF